MELENLNNERVLLLEKLNNEKILLLEKQTNLQDAISFLNDLLITNTNNIIAIDNEILEVK